MHVTDMLAWLSSSVCDLMDSLPSFISLKTLVELLPSFRFTESHNKDLISTVISDVSSCFSRVPFFNILWLQLHAQLSREKRRYEWTASRLIACMLETLETPSKFGLGRWLKTPSTSRLGRWLGCRLC